jgi:FkbM family methyltransferase
MILSRLAQGFEHYGNPYQMLMQRLLPNRFDLFNVKDRASGVACWCTPSSHQMFSEIWFYKNYDIPRLTLRPGDVVLDVGANQGIYSCYAAFHGARVIAFEPHQQSLAILQRNLERNGFAHLVEPRLQAVGAQSGEVEFYVTPAFGGVLNTTSTIYASHFDHVKSGTVECVTLAEILKNESLDRVRLCKLDCEGAELEILQSIEVETASRIDGFAIEYHPEAYSIVELIDCLHAWETHEIMFAAAKGKAAISFIYAIAKSAQREIATSI